jgi:hypothetical protein
MIAGTNRIESNMVKKSSKSSTLQPRTSFRGTPLNTRQIQCIPYDAVSVSVEECVISSRSDLIQHIAQL